MALHNTFVHIQVKGLFKEMMYALGHLVWKIGNVLCLQRKEISYIYIRRVS